MKKLIVLLLFFWAGFVYANNLPSGDEIVEKINARDEGVAVSRSLKMTMVDRRGKQRVRTTKAFRKYYGDNKKTAIFYLEPKNVKDTAFLTNDYSDVDQEDEQWLYLPAMRKVRRISASDRGDYFLGTDFTYEDIKLETRVSVSDYRFNTIGRDTVNQTSCIVVQAFVVNEKIAKELGHTKREDCIDDQNWMPLRSVLWDLKGNLLKTIYFDKIFLVDEIWTAHELRVENHKTGHQTYFEFSEVKYDDTLSDNLFTSNSLRRGL